MTGRTRRRRCGRPGACWPPPRSRRAEELRESYRDREAEYPADWRTALGTSYDVLHATPEELITLQRRMTELLGEYRRLSRGERPPGARRVQVVVDLAPWFPPPAQQEDGDEPE